MLSELKKKYKTQSRMYLLILGQKDFDTKLGVKQLTTL